MASWFMCHTWGLARSPAELQGGQGQGHQGVPLQVKKHSLLSRFSSVISTYLAMLSVWMASGVVMHLDIETQEMVNRSRAMFLTTIKVCNIH